MPDPSRSTRMTATDPVLGRTVAIQAEPAVAKNDSGRTPPAATSGRATPHHVRPWSSVWRSPPSVRTQPPAALVLAWLTIPGVVVDAGGGDVPVVPIGTLDAVVVARPSFAVVVVA